MRGVCSHEMSGGNMRNIPEENALKSSCMEKEKACLPKLDTRLHHILFFEEMEVTNTALPYECSRIVITLEGV